MKQIIRIVFTICILGASAWATCTSPCVDTQGCNGISTCTTAAMVNTGATAIVVTVAGLSQDTTTLTITSSPSNSFTCSANFHSTGAGISDGGICYVLTPSVSGAQTITMTGCSGFCYIAAVSVSGTTTLDGSIQGVASTSADGTGGATIVTFQDTGITTSANNSVFVSGVAAYCAGTAGAFAVDSSLVIAQSACLTSTMDGAISYGLIASSGTAVNPTWTPTGCPSCSTTFSGIAVMNIAFKGPAASSAPAQPTILGIL